MVNDLFQHARSALDKVIDPNEQGDLYMIYSESDNVAVSIWIPKDPRSSAFYSPVVVDKGKLRLYPVWSIPKIVVSGVRNYLPSLVTYLLGVIKGYDKNHGR